MKTMEAKNNAISIRSLREKATRIIREFISGNSYLANVLDYPWIDESFFQAFRTEPALQLARREVGAEKNRRPMGLGFIGGGREVKVRRMLIEDKQVGFKTRN